MTKENDGRIDVVACVLNQVPQLATIAPAALAAQTNGTVAEVPQLSPSLTHFFDTMLNRSHISQVRVTFEVDVSR